MTSVQTDHIDLSFKLIIDLRKTLWSVVTDRIKESSYKKDIEGNERG